MILLQLIDLYSIVVIVAVIMSWIDLPANNPVAQVVYGLTEPLLVPIRRALPPMAGLDFSPMILLIGLRVLRGVIIGGL